MNPSYGVAGLVVGIAVGLTGIGGSALLAPILTLGFGVPASLTVGTDLLYSVPTKILACILQIRRGNVDWSITKLLCAGGLPGALLGLAAFAYVRSSVSAARFETFVAHAIGVAILVASVGVLVAWLPRFSRPVSDALTADRGPAFLVGIGAIVGFLVSLTSIGAGSVTLPLLAFSLRSIALRRLVGSEIAFAAFLVPLAALGHLGFGNVDWRIALMLMVGSLPGVWIGTRLGTVLGDKWLRPIIAGLLLLSGWRLV